jgi:hypothetical protein
MSAPFLKQDGKTWHVQVTGLLKKAEMDAAQASVAEAFKKGGTINMLIVLENFQGWAKGGDWNDMTFLLEHGDRIEKMSIVGDRKWETQVMAFVGAGYRSTQIQFFSSEEKDQAQAWLG